MRNPFGNDVAVIRLLSQKLVSRKSDFVYPNPQPPIMPRPPDSRSDSRRRRMSTAQAVQEAYGVPPRAQAPLAREHLADRELNADEPLPTIELKSPTWHVHLFRKRLGAWDPRANHGDLVRVALSGGETFGYGLFNPRSEITVRLLSRGESIPDRQWWRGRLEAAVSLRRELLRLDERTDAYRLVHAEGDGLTGLVVDRYGPVLSAEIFSLAIWQRRRELLSLLGEIAGTTHWIARPGPRTARQEGFEAGLEWSDGCPEHLNIVEDRRRFRIDLAGGHKTGYFCDQRENRRVVGEFAAGRSVLDLCCYTGGFGITAEAGGAASVTGIDLDEQAIAIAKQNAKLNRGKARFVHSDAFNYMRDIAGNDQKFGLVVLDPPKLIASRQDFEEGRKRYFDMNRLAIPLVEPGGLLMTCSCSGLMPLDEFRRTVFAAAPGGRRIQILETRGAAPDHPIASDCPDSEYLKALWLRIN